MKSNIKTCSILEIKRKISKYEGRLEALQEFCLDELIEKKLPYFAIQSIKELLECLEYILELKEKECEDER